MRIAILDIDDLRNPHWGSGQAKATYEIGKRLARNHKITVYSSKYPGFKNYRKNGIQFIHIGTGTNNAKVNNLAFLFSLPFVIPKIKADIIIENFTAPITTCFTPLFTKLPVVGLTSFFASDQMAKKYHLGFDKVERVGLSLYHNIIALNEDQKKYVLKQKKNTHVAVIPNGVDSKYLTQKTTEQNYILYIGRIDMYSKGLDLLIRSLSTIKDTISENVVIMGSGSKEDTDRLISLITKYKLTKRVKLVGKKSGKEKDELLANAKVIVFPSRFESHSLASLEALALGKPIVCFDIQGFKWLENNAALKARALNTKDFAQKLSTVLKNSKTRKTLSQKARTLAKQYTWEKTSRLFERFLLQTVQ